MQKLGVPFISIFLGSESHFTLKSFVQIEHCSDIKKKPWCSWRMLHYHHQYKLWIIKKNASLTFHTRVSGSSITRSSPKLSFYISQVSNHWICSTNLRPNITDYFFKLFQNYLGLPKTCTLNESSRACHLVFYNTNTTTIFFSCSQQSTKN